MRAIGIIPARGGSKSVPLKNIKDLCGRPLLVYTVQAALQCPKLDRVVVSTDHAKIAEIARGAGAQVIIRPPELATDQAPSEQALIHVLEELKREGYTPDVAITLEPTSPLRSTHTITRCVEIFATTDADSVIGVVETRSCYGRITNERFEFLFPGQPRRRQDREPLYKESSTIYGTRVTTLYEKNSVLGDRLYPLVVDEVEAIDINAPLDFALAEFMMTQKLQEGM